MAKKKFYVVWDGIETGIFDSWEKCKSVITNYPQAKFKSFQTLEMAKEAYSGNYYEYVGKKIVETSLSKEELLKIGKPILDSISVDAACSGNPGVMEYRGVNTKTKEQLFIMGPFENGTNNVGEFLALVHGISLLKKKGISLPIYSDSRNAISWVKQKVCKTNLEKNESNAKLFELISRAEIWLKNNSYENKILKWETKAWGEIPADFGRKQ
ncbi:MAG: viroplasmin family protein [Flavobacteriales bacterium]|nr:viroplasmin family protein [Flavobacteriales bacterium]